MNINQAPKGSGKQSPIPTADSHRAVLIQVVGLGLQPGGVWEGQKKPDKVKVRFTYELPDQKAEFDGEEKPLIISEDMNFSGHEKSGMVARLNVLDPQNETGGDLFKLLGKSCLIQVKHKAGNGKNAGRTFANIGSVTSLPSILPSITPEEVFNPLVAYDPSAHDEDVFSKLPQFLQDKIKDRLDAPANAVRQESAEEQEQNELPPGGLPTDVGGEW